MGDLDKDTTLTRIGEDRFRATLSDEWEIWGPMGGYVAALTLRAAGAVSPFSRPASLACHYLGVARFEDVELTVTTLRLARTAAAHRVTLSQGDRPVVESLVWTIGDVEGLEHRDTTPPDVAPPEELLSMAERFPDQSPPFAFWNNLDSKPIGFEEVWPPDGPREPVWQTWARFKPAATFRDPFVDAARSVILIDVQSWPSASRPHTWKQPPFVAPSLDLYVAFNEPDPASEWLLTDGHSPVGADGLLGWTGRLWSQSGRLVASGAGQALCRRVGGSAVST
jgi:acyl-CoA thioesterase-2